MALLAACVTLYPHSGFGDASRPAEPKTGDAVSEAAYFRIGGIEQWITIRGDDRANPVILFLHGGPGNPMSPWSAAVYGAWESEFTLVQWDQRGSGRTYARDEPVEELTLERFHATELSVDLLVRDAIEVAELVRTRLGREKLVLTGGSWGSVLGIHLAKARPDLFHAYIGVSQLVDYREASLASYTRVRDRARSREDAAALEVLDSIGAPPWSDPRSFGKLRRICRAYELAATSPYPELVYEAGYDSDAYRAAYGAGEELSFLKFVGLADDGMAAGIALRELGPRFEIPVHFLQGAEDLLTVPEVTRAYHDWIEAPAKSLTLVPAAGHDPNLAMIEQHRALVRACVLAARGGSAGEPGAAQPRHKPLR